MIPARDPATEGHHLSGPELEPFLSPYLRGGHQADAYEVVSVSMIGNEVRAECRMASYFVSPTDEGGFHLSANNVLHLTGVVGIIHGLWYHGFDAKPFEVIMNDFSVTFSRMQRDPERITFRGELVGRTVLAASPADPRRAPRTFCRWRFDVCEGAAWGEATASFPFGAEVEPRRARP